MARARSSALRSVSFVLALTCSACGGDDDVNEDDRDASTATDAGRDAALEVEEDAGEVEEDAGEIALDATVDAGTDASTGDDVQVATAADLARESAADYATNTYGLITGATLGRWVRDWAATRPAAITGDLVILQIVPTGATSRLHVSPVSAGVRTYDVPQASLLEERDSGLSSIEAEIPRGESTDAFLQRYRIDPRRDLVVWVFEQLPGTTGGAVQQLGRGWLWLAYWGTEPEHLAVLNGTLDWNGTNEGLPVAETAATTPPDDGTTRVSDLRRDHTTLVVHVGELIPIVRDADPAYRVLDARGGAEALGLPKATNSGRRDCASYTGTGTNSRCSPLFEGRIRGARTVPWTQLLTNAEGGFRFLPKSELRAIFDAQAALAPNLTYIHYCRTNVRSMVTGLASILVLGLPTRWYDASFIEWSHLAHGPTSATQLLPADSPWRTDLPALTEHNLATGYTPGGNTSDPAITPGEWVAGPRYNVDDDISPTRPVIRPEATSSAGTIETDRAYLRAR
ncbi:hypothetical protein [Sandaracinus amylolyticus]|uniref:hypothetical protein n=1 Tax=Sandaracinus amylolyticus TaxID=927083 RepID=UPI001F38CFD6|nr:hypothetical protein [Sandaracinus amylolyticus]UJR79519.1 Sulfurtransferase [Sandaracinus amylolyticus]